MDLKLFREDPGEAARALEDMDRLEAAAALTAVTPEIAKGALELIRPEILGEILAQVDPRRGAEYLAAMDPAYAASVPVPEQVKSLLPKDVTQRMQAVLAYPEGTVGHIMDPRVMAVNESLTVRQAIGEIQKRRAEPFSYVFVVDGEHRLKGVLNFRQLLLADPEQSVSQVMIRQVIAVQASADRASLPELMREHSYLALPVLDAEGRLLGTISADEAIAVAEAEASEDIQRMFGAGAEEQPLTPVTHSVRMRLPWLIVNLGTAFLASAVVAPFESILSQVAVLAVLMPIVAGQGGNTGAQTLAVVIRGLAMGQIERGRIGRLVLKEVTGGLISGVVIALLAAGLVAIWHRELALAYAIGCAMLMNVIAAVLAGTLIPIGMRALGRDPAQSSSIILTTVTDVVGLFAFLQVSRMFLGI